MFALDADHIADLQWFFLEAESQCGIRSGQSLFQAQLMAGLVDRGGLPPDPMPERSEKARRRAVRIHRNLERVREAGPDGVAHTRVLFWAFGTVRQPERQKRLIARLRDRIPGRIPWSELIQIMDHAPVVEQLKARRIKKKSKKPYSLEDAELPTLLKAKIYAEAQLEAAARAYTAVAEAREADSVVNERRRRFESAIGKVA